MRYYIKQMNIAEPNSWHVFDCQETDETGEHICKESDVSHKDAMKYRDSLEHDDFMLRAAELRENLVGGHPSSPQPLAPITDMTVGVDTADFGEWVAMVNYLALKDQNAEKDAEIAALKAEVARMKVALNEIQADMGRILRSIEPYNDAYYVGKRDVLKALLGKLQAPEAVTPEAPSEVTLTADEIEWLAEHQELGGYKWPKHGAGFIKSLETKLRLSNLSDQSKYYYLAFLTDEHDTAANRAAIEARRKKLAQG